MPGAAHPLIVERGFSPPAPLSTSSDDLRSRGLPPRGRNSKTRRWPMATVVSKTGIRREQGWLYFLDKQGDVSRVRMQRSGQRVPKGRQKVAKCGVDAGGRLALLHRQEGQRLQGEDEALEEPSKGDPAQDDDPAADDGPPQAGAQEAGAPEGDRALRPRVARRRGRSRRSARGARPSKRAGAGGGYPAGSARSGSDSAFRAGPYLALAVGASSGGGLLHPERKCGLESGP